MVALVQVRHARVPRRRGPTPPPGRRPLGQPALPALRRCTERNGKIVDFYLYLAAALLTVRSLI